MKKGIILLGLVTLLWACGGNAGDKKAELDKLKKQQSELNARIAALEEEIAKSDTTQKTSKVVDVIVTPVAYQPFRSYVDIQGKVDADQNVTISAQAPGTVKAIYLHEGDNVAVGTVIAELDDAVLSQSREELKGGLALATDLYNKQKNLWDQKIGSEVQYLTAKNTKESLESRMKTLNEQLALYKIKSPINGTVDEVMLKIGQTIAPGMPAVRVVNLSSLKAKADVSESYAGKIHEGNDVTVVFPDLNKEVSSKIAFVSRVISSMNRTFTVEVDLQSSPDYHPNMVAFLKIVDYKAEEAIALPINLVQNSENGYYVFVAIEEGGKTVAHRQPVKVGRDYNGVAEIIDGLKVGDRVITTGYQDVEDGELLRL